jgi:hypothetical protein
MSRSYYNLIPPVTSILLLVNTKYSRISVYINNSLSGVLMVPSEHVEDIILLFADRSVRKPPVVSAFLGSDLKIVVTVNDKSLRDDQVLIREDGVPMSLSDIKAIGQQS